MNIINSKPEKHPKRRSPKKITESYLQNSGLYYLQRFTASKAHFMKVMTLKIDRSCNFHKDQNRSECIALLEKVTQGFVDAGLLNDISYAKAMVNSYRRRGMSKRMILTKLKTKGLDQAIIIKTLNDHDGHEPEQQENRAAIQFAKRKKKGPYSKKTKYDDIQFKKDLQAFARAGFSYDMANKVLSMTEEDIKEFNEADDFLNHY